MTKHFDVEEAVRLYESGMTQKQVGEIMGVDEMTIRRRLLVAGVHIRTCSEALNGKPRKPLSDETKKAISEALKGKPGTRKGKPHSDESKKAISEALNGRSLSDEHKKAISESMKGEKNPSYIDGRYPETQAIRHSLKYAEWRLMVFGRDNFTCLECGTRGVELNAHHVLRFANYPEFRYTVENGITLCKTCHYKINRHEEDFEEYFFNLLFNQ